MKEDTNIVNNGLDADLDTVTVSQKADDDQVDVNSELDDADNALSSTSDNIDIPNSAVDYPMKHEFDSLSACNNNRVLDESTENDNIIMIPSKSMDTVTSIESTATINTTGSQAYNKEITSSREEYISHLKTIIPNVNDIASCEEDEQPIIIPSEVTSAMSMDESQLLEYQNQNQSLLNNTPSSDANTDSLTNDNNHIPSPELMVDTTYDAATYISSPSESSSLSLQSDKDIDTMPISNVAYFIQEANNTKNIAEIEKPVNLNLIDTKPTAIVHSKAEENLGLSSKETSTTEPITANCIYYPHCTNKRCKFVHPGNDNVMPPKKKSTAGNSQNGRNNTKKTMTWAERIDKQARPHPPIWKSRCVHWPKCTNNNCKYSHPSKPCR
ncbi:uncharacterized protein BX663DRAFT_516702 [Cokeromyces recurvatus]|uniref:uncharacterized protein n=1 Tax=Cokeromyces recurvatus TaxID=90255 RepID=UPI002220AE76|nr:uncharacterized protein BX663DRAFT_516702 [Cokeromyces recurvatus]KAI7900842.1 hypothetical protein BX663DRAFT_516702 [Cokeromyces recurvatus]